ncbi:MAG: carboxylate-amine ligase [Ignavibacteriae bacterium HGW-Ignavibacteriae-3]|nr:MAG: carboxylate-amine ligase [Ignavibacteriae bacterium HGW-Ignavibacteriae-3]
MSQDKLFSIGIEEEFQIIDPKTRELKSHIEQIMGEGKVTLKEQVKAEMHQSVVEVGSNICYNIQEARSEVVRLRSTLAKIAKSQGLEIAAAGTHPFSRWEEQEITDHPRYHSVVEDMQQVARANLIFGLHVHVGMNDKNEIIHVMNAMRYFLPHIFALSASSPFWKGRDTGFKSYRSKIFDRFPRTGIPDHFNSYSEYESYVNLLVKTGCIDNAKKIWWDIRPHPFFNTLEIRICDIPMRVDETVAVAALIQAVAAKLHKLLKQNLGFRLYRRLYINENKWRAARYGLEGKMIDFGKQTEVPTIDLIKELILFVDDVLDELGSREEINFIHEMLKMKSSATRQLKVFKDTNDLTKVVDFIIQETNLGLNI